MNNPRQQNQIECFDNQGQHKQTLTLDFIPLSISQPRVGFAMSANDRYVAFSIPTQASDHYSALVIYALNETLDYPQVISTDNGLLGEQLYVFSQNKSSPFGDTLTIMASDENGSDFGSLKIYQP